MAVDPETQERTVALPTGTVTFLFTDIEGSTQRWESYRAAMDAAVKCHDALLRSAIGIHGGHIFKTGGDAFCVAFARASDALTACVEAQRSLAEEDFSAVHGIRVRSALHTGEAVERDGDYFGPALNRVARLMAIGHGGQILLSEATHGLVHGDLPTQTLLMDLGLHRLRDLSEPEHVWQVTVVGLPADFPPLRSLDELPNNLPVQVTSFLGRERDVDEVKRLLDKHRALTLVGSAGVGKTRLAVQAGAELLDRFHDGVWFADLGPITDPELVSSIIASAIGMSQIEGKRVDESIPAWLSRRQLLLILDNCEHLLEAVAAIADAIHRHAPKVRMLATSRQPLGIAGEAIHRLPSLPVPDVGLALTANDMSKYGAIAVFADRAALADTRFTLTDDNALIVAEICRRLDGIPLAIELAAARVKVLSIPNLAQRLDERFTLLTGGSKAALPRQKTLSAMLDWSYDLLTPQEQVLFCRLAIFAGSFSFEAAATICAGEDIEDSQILDLVASLADKSLAAVETSGEKARYHLLESTRAYAVQKLKVRGELTTFARRHAEYFRDQARNADDRYGTGSTLNWFAAVELDLDNYRAALEWALTARNDAVIGGTIAGALAMLWFRGGLSTEGKYWIGLALDNLDEDENAWTAARLRRALAMILPPKASCEAAARAVKLYDLAGDSSGAAWARYLLAFGLSQTGRVDEASRECQRALATLREEGDDAGAAWCARLQADIAGQQGNHAKARQLYAQALAIQKRIGDELSSGATLGNLAELEFDDGHPEEALRLVREALALDTRHGVDSLNLAMLLNNSTAYQIALGDVDGARKAARDALQSGRQAQNRELLAIGLQHFGLIAALRGSCDTAARLGGYADAQFNKVGFQRGSTEAWGYEKLRAALREKLSETEITQLSNEGAAWSEDQAIEEAVKI